MNPNRDDYDSSWKDLPEHYFQPFMAQFFSATARDIAWQQGHEFLNKELQKVTRKAAAVRRYAVELKYPEQIHRLKEETRMRYVTGAERIGMKRGLENAALLPDLLATCSARIQPVCSAR